jgi:SAM-dependent methyltransferase
MVELAKLNNQQLMDSEIVEFKLGDISKLPHLSESVDKIFTVNTIYFWDQPDLAFKECKRVLKSNGLLAIAIRPESCLKKYPSTKFNFKHYTIKDVEELLAKHGFDIDSIIKESEPKTEVLEEIITPEFAVIIGRKLS